MSLSTALEEIGSAAFKGCSSLEAIDLSATKITSIEGSTFFDCFALESVTIPKTVTEICGEAFHEAGIVTFTVSGGTTTAKLIICDYAFHLVDINGATLVSTLEGIYQGGVEVDLTLAFSGD